MKKVLSFVLVLAMILGSVSMAFATTIGYGDKTDAKPFADAPNSKLATVLRDLNVLQGNDGKVFLDQPISRAEVCAILMRVLGYEAYCTAEYAINAASSFSDVASGYWANGYINLAAQLGYVSGVGNGKFNPTGNVGLNDGVAFVMKALGYSAEHLPLDWPYNFLVKAESLGLLKGIEKTEGVLTREEMFTILYNAMNKAIVKWSISDIGLVKGDSTLGSYVNTGYTFQAKAGSGYTVADYISGTGIVSPDVVEAAAASKLDLSDYEGEYVNFLVRHVSGGAYDRIGVLEVLSTELAGEYEEKGTAATLAGVSLATKVALLSQLADAYTMINGKAEEYASVVAIEDADEIKAQVLLNKKGVATTVASVELWVPTKTYKVDATAAALFGTEYDATRAAVAEYLSSSALGFVVSDASVKKTDWEILGVELVGVDSFEDIKENDVITLYVDSNNKIEKIVVAREVIEGQVSARATNKWTINGKAYTTLIPGEYDALMKTSNYAFYLDANGYIFAAKNLDRTSVVVPGYSFGFITTYASVFEQHYDAAKLAIVPVTDNSISIMPLGGTEAVSFSNVSQGAMDTTWMDGSADGNAKWDTTKTKIGQLVAYKLNAAGGLGEMKLVSNFSANGTATVTDAGLKNLTVATTNSGAGEKADANGYAGKLFAADVQIISVINAAGKMVITNKTVADIQKTTYPAVAYELNAANKICKFFVIGTGSVASTTTNITAAALTTWGEDDAQYYNALVDGKDAKYVITGEAFTFASDAAVEKKATLFALELNSLGQVTSIVAIDEDGSAAAEDCEYAGGVLVVSAGGVGALAGSSDPVVVSFVNPVIYVYNKVFTVIDEAGVAAALEAATSVEVYDFEGDGYYDVLVIK